MTTFNCDPDPEPEADLNNICWIYRIRIVVPPMRKYHIGIRVWQTGTSAANGLDPTLHHLISRRRVVPLYVKFGPIIKPYLRLNERLLYPSLIFVFTFAPS